MALMKRFETSDAFIRNADYKLLPIRFTELDKERVVISNMAGEHLVISNKDLNSLILRDKRLDESLLDELYSKHMIYDGVSQLPLKLSGLKYRTKISRLKNFTSLHMVVTTLRCDYTCHYCQVSRQNLASDNSKFDMSIDTAEKSIDLIFKSPAKALKIEFQGGESLLNFDVIKHIVINAEIRGQSEGRNMQYVIATNLTPLNDEILLFCKQYKIYISTSLDGPRKLHNRNRPRPDNNGHELTVSAIEKVKNHLGVDYVSALMTTAGRSLDFSKEIIDEYISNGLHSIFLRPLSPYGFAVTKGHINRYDTEVWLEFFKKSLDYIIDVNKQGYPLIEQYSSLILTKMLTVRDLGYVDLQSPTGALISGMIYNYDGDVYASDEARMQAEIGHHEFKLGNVHNNTYEEIIGNEFMLDSIDKSMSISSPQCSDCAFLPYCGSDPVYHLATQNDVVGNKQLSGFCKKNMGIFKHLICLLEDGDAQTKSILKSWARY